jgi:competence protein ComEA
MRQKAGNSFNTKARFLSLLSVVVALFAGGMWIKPSAGQGRQLPDGPGKEETRKICSQCHEVEKALSARYDRAGWQRTLDKKISIGAKGTEKEFQAVLEYLVKNFHADEVPKININNARAIELESGLSLKRSQAAAIIRYRAKNGPFKSIEDLKKIPGVDAEKIEAKRDRLIF